MNIPVRSEGGALIDLLFSHFSSFMFFLSLKNAVT